MSKLPSCYREVTQDDIIRFFKGVGIKAACTLCHHNEFDIPLMEKSTALDLFNITMGEGTSQPKEYVRPFLLCDEVLGNDIVSFPLTCKRCGNIMLVNAEILLDWKEQQAKSEQGESHE
ncbi:hypothetical protein N7319_21550 [Aeromonas dhakensis]|uniref:hypothetical protein n=1 Tax=Aeromonas TaxID=642 RepID=UPI00244976EB|nr:hypothetical protein [Aeromonas dhakensis]MDH0177779.1 hypothetical protein [Aeromonas dhakensis]HDZ8896384.1 hypothetical protein [Aeromonas dhakensis]